MLECIECHNFHLIGCHAAETDAPTITLFGTTVFVISNYCHLPKTLSENVQLVQFLTALELSVFQVKLFHLKWTGADTNPFYAINQTTMGSIATIERLFRKAYTVLGEKTLEQEQDRQQPAKQPLFPRVAVAAKRGQAARHDGEAGYRPGDVPRGVFEPWKER